MEKKTRKVVTQDDPEFEAKWRRALINARAYEMEAKYQAKLAKQRNRKEINRYLSGKPLDAEPIPEEAADVRAERIAKWKEIAEANMQKSVIYAEMNTYLEDHTWEEWLQEKKRRKRNYTADEIKTEKLIERAEQIAELRELKRMYGKGN